MFLHKTPLPVQWLYPNCIWKKSRQEKHIYLTFDDGPIPGLTEFILDTLKQYNVKATFFCVGENLVKNRSIAERALGDGHLLANHSFNHLNGWKTTSIDYISNVVRCQSELIDITENQEPPYLLRPPYGKIKRAQIKALKKKYSIIMWDVLSGDFMKSISPEVCLKNTIKATANGSIVLFHDNLKAEASVKYALPRYIKHFLKEGYSFKVL